MLRERMEETQVMMTTEANEKRQAHPFRVGDEAFLDTRLLPVGYTNVTGTASDSNNSEVPASIRRTIQVAEKKWERMRSCWIFQPTGAYILFSTLAASSHQRSTGAGNTHHRRHCVLPQQSITKWKAFGSIEAVPSEIWNVWSSGWGTPTLRGNRWQT